MAKKKFYKSKFTRKWLEDPLLQNWIQPSIEDEETAYCPFCDRHLKGSRTLMQRHARNPKHQRNVQAGTNKKIGSPVDGDGFVYNVPEQEKVKVEVKVHSKTKAPKKFPQKWGTDPELNLWIIPSTDPNYKAYCKFCMCGINGNKSEMLKHALTPEHIKEYHLLRDSNELEIVPPQDMRESHNILNDSSMKLNNSESTRVDFDSEVLAQISKEMGCKIVKIEPNEVQPDEDLDEDDGEDYDDDDDMLSSNEFEDNIETEESAKLRNTREKPVSGRSDNDIPIPQWKKKEPILIQQWKKKEPSLKKWLKASSVPGNQAFCKWCRIHINGDMQTMLNHALTHHKINSKKKKIYDQKFNKDWLTDPLLKSWISAPVSSSKTAFCTKCERHLKGSKTQMYRHAQNPRHIKITQKPQVNDDIVKSALRMSAFVVENNLPLNIMNHVLSLVKSVASDSDLVQYIDCGPEKTEFFIKNVLAIDRLNDLSNKLVSTVFSIIVDESTDIFSNKSIALVVRYYDEDTKTVEDSFLTIIDVTDPSSLSQSIIDFFSSLNVPLSNLLGFAADGSSPLIGKYSSTQIRLSQINPFLYISSCVHHSFQYCVSDACSKIPDTFEKLCYDMYDYMHYMPQQVAGFDQVWPLFPSEAQDMIKFSNIRWLSICEVVTKIVDNWDMLISYFNICATNELDIKAQQILVTLTEPMTKLVFLFLNFFLPTVDDLNLEFQGTKYCHHSLLSTIGDKIKTILKFYMKASYVNETAPSDLNPVDESKFLILENMYFGTRVEAMILTLDPSSSYEMILHFKGHCLNFYMEFCTQLLGRFDFKDPVLKYLYMLNPEICKSDLYLSIRPMAMLFPNVIEQDMLPQLESEWFDIKSSPKLFGNEEFIPFWNRVFQQKNADFSTKYPQMTKLVKALLCLPHSSEATKNTFVEIRKNNIKNNNKHDSAMMSSFLLIREKLQGSSAVNFEVSNELLLLAKSSLKL